MRKIRSLINIFGILIFYYLTAIGLTKCGMDPLTVTAIVDIMIATLLVSWWTLHKECRIMPCQLQNGFGTLLFMFLLMFIAGQLTGTMIESIFGLGSFKQYQTTMHANAAIALLLSLIIAPIGEECLVRGFIYQQLRRDWGFWVAWFGQAGLFALMHGTLVHAVPTFLTALFLGLLYERTGDLRWPIGFHMVYNLLVVFASGVSVPKVLYAPWVDIPLDIVCVLAMAVMFAKVIDDKCINIHREKPISMAHLATRPIERRKEESYETQEKNN